MPIRVVSDSASDMFECEGIDYTTVPLKIMFGGKEYVDEPGIDAEDMVRKLQTHDGPSTTSCPNVKEWIDAFDGAKEIFAVTISSGLSGSFEAAEIARRQYTEEHPDAKVHVFDSKATGPFMRLIIEKIAEAAQVGATYEVIKETVSFYIKRIRILYSLESLNNLARNGRVNQHVARIASALNIRVIGHASTEGTVELLHKLPGENRAMKTLVQDMLDAGFEGGRVCIDHCLNSKAAEKLKTLISVKFPQTDVSINPCGGLCSYYADKGGLIVGYEVAP